MKEGWCVVVGTDGGLFYTVAAEARTLAAAMERYFMMDRRGFVLVDCLLAGTGLDSGRLYLTQRWVIVVDRDEYTEALTVYISVFRNH